MTRINCIGEKHGHKKYIKFKGNIVKRPVVSFYVTIEDNMHYKRWCYLSKNNYHNQISGWIKSGNIIAIGKGKARRYYGRENKNTLVLNTYYYECLKK